MALTFLLARPTFAFDRDAYQDGDLVSAAPSLAPAPANGLHLYLDAAGPRFKTTATFTGRTRILPEERGRLIRYWLRALQLPGEHEQLFRREIELVQAGVHWWLPMQSSLEADFLGEVEVGTPVKVYVLHIGAVNGQAVFLVNAFEAILPSPSTDRPISRSAS